MIGKCHINNQFISPAISPAIHKSFKMLGKKQVVLFVFTILFMLTESIDRSKYEITIERPWEKAFSSITHICCNGVTHEKVTLDTKCCGNQTYYSDSYICCDRSIVLKNSHIKCCSNQLYDSKTHNCTLFVVDANFNNNYLHFGVKNGVYVVLPITDKYTFPCGNEIINLNKSMCCSSRPVSLNGLKNQKCCDGELYDSNVNSCCFDTSEEKSEIIPKVNNSQYCCNKKPYNVLEQVCNRLDKTIIDLPDKNHTYCNNQFVNKNEKICCYGKTINKLKDHHTECCGNVSYSPSEQSCCEGKLVSIEEPTKCCIGVGLYDPAKDTCCSPHNFLTRETKSKLFKDKLGQCCYLEIYNATKEYCCGISVMPKMSDGQSNCCQFNINGVEASVDELSNAYKETKNDNVMYYYLYNKLLEIQAKKNVKPDGGNCTPSKFVPVILILLSILFNIKYLN